MGLSPGMGTLPELGALPGQAPVSFTPLAQQAQGAAPLAAPVPAALPVPSLAARARQATDKGRAPANSARIEHTLFDRRPVEVMLRIDRERLVRLPFPAMLEVPPELTGALEAQMIEDTVYLTALEPIKRSRVLAHALDGSGVIPLDLSASAKGDPKPELEVHYPGTGLSDEFKDRFLLCDFRGGPANSGIRSFRVEPQGAFFSMMDDQQPFWRHLSQHGVDVGLVALDRVGAVAPQGIRARSVIRRQVDHLGRLDLRVVAGPGIEILEPRQRTVDAGARHFQRIGIVQRILDIEHRRDRSRDLRAIIDLDPAFGPVRHDLQGLGVAAHQPDPHKLEPQTFDGRGHDLGQTAVDGGFGD